MRFWCLLLTLFLMMPAVAGNPVADVKLVAHQYFDEYERQWHEVDSLCIRELTGPCDCIEQSCGGAEMAEVTLSGLKMETQYEIRVRWVNGTTLEEVRTVYEPGTEHLWIDRPSSY